MKASEILKWICKESINGEDLNMIEIPDWWEQDDEAWVEMFGGVPSKTIASGKYLYYYDIDIPYAIQIDENVFEADAQIEIPVNNGGFDYAYFYRVED